MQKSALHLFIILHSLIGGMLPLCAQSEGEPCGITWIDSIQKKKFPQWRDDAVFEHWLNRQIATAPLAQLRSTITIPVIVHIVHQGEAIGVGTNISSAQVASQLEVLNEDFQRRSGTPGYNTNTLGAALEIEFCLANLDEYGQAMAEPGIHRYNGGRQQWRVQDIESDLKPKTVWNPQDYFNIWVLDIGATRRSEVIAYAQFPIASGLLGLETADSLSNTDGVVVDYRAFGSAQKGEFPVLQSPHNQGRALTHETGHWLGLRHIWGDVSYCGDDFCSDTPKASGPTYGCSARYTCGGRNMIENYMDYTDDACMNLFTKEQQKRMLAVLRNSPRRKSLLNSKACEALFDNAALQQKVKIFPNPARNELTIQLNSEAYAVQSLESRVQVFDWSGKLLYNSPLDLHESQQIDLSNFASGCLVVKLTKGDLCRVEKIVKI